MTGPDVHDLPANATAAGSRLDNGTVTHRAVLFDLDDTLLRSVEAYWEHHRAVCREVYGFELGDDELREHWGKPYPLLLPALYRASDSYPAMLAAERSLAHRFPVAVFDDARSTLEALASAGIPVGIVTSADRALVLDDLRRIGFPPDRLAVLQTAEDTDVHKPDPAVFTPAMERLGQLGIAASETLYVGDSLSDFAAARGAGLSFLGVATGLVSKEEFRAAGAPEVTGRLGAWFATHQL